VQKATPIDRDYVVLLHGLGRTQRSMVTLGRRLEGCGLSVVNIGYRSRSGPINELSAYVWEEIGRRCTDRDRRIHFVTHSLGGIILRHGLKTYGLNTLGRSVMLSPPNQGSEVIDILGRFSICRAILGPAGIQLGTTRHSLPNQLGPVDFELGVIIGDQSLSSIPPLPSSLFGGANDGKVSVARAGIPGMADLLVLPCGHTFIMNSLTVAAQVSHFMRHGVFERSSGGLP
jgi:triacylglycerol lipase